MQGTRAKLQGFVVAKRVGLEESDWKLERPPELVLLNKCERKLGRLEGQRERQLLHGRVLLPRSSCRESALQKHLTSLREAHIARQFVQEVMLRGENATSHSLKIQGQRNFTELQAQGPTRQKKIKTL
jgi:hypothetical protein